MKHTKNFFSSEAVRLSCAALVCFFAVYLSFAPSALLATLALPVFAGLLVPFFYDEASHIIPITFVCSVLLSLILTETTLEKVVYSVALTAFLALGVFANHLLRALVGKNKNVKVGCFGIALSVLAFGGYLLVFGNPVSLTLKSAKAMDFYKSAYPQESFTLTQKYYDPIHRAYTTEIQISTLESFRASSEEDGYLALMKEHAAQKQKAALISLLRTHFSDGTYQITIDTSHSDTKGTSENLLGDAPDKWLCENHITLEFDSAVSVDTLNAKSQFAAKVRDYVAVLQNENFPFASITFRAGEYEEMVYELTATPDSTEDDLIATKVKDLRD